MADEIKETTGQEDLLAELNAKVGVLETAVADKDLSLIPISEPTRLRRNSYAVF